MYFLKPEEKEKLLGYEKTFIDDFRLNVKNYF
jgi:hypothetical protein